MVEFQVTDARALDMVPSRSMGRRKEIADPGTLHTHEAEDISGGRGRQFFGVGNRSWRYKWGH
jgi:hypothetical protein